MPSASASSTLSRGTGAAFLQQQQQHQQQQDQQQPQTQHQEDDSDPQPHSAANGSTVTETSPLLGQRSSSLPQRPWLRLTPRSIKSCAIRIAIALLLLLIVGAITIVAVVYYAYIPLRLQKGSGEGSIQLNNFHVDAINVDTIDIRMNATQFIKEPPPVDILMSEVEFLVCSIGSMPPPRMRARPSIFPPNVPVSWLDDDKILGIPRKTTPPVILSLPFPGLVTKMNSTEVHIVFSAPFQRLDTKFISKFVTNALGYALASTTLEPGPAPSPETFRQQGIPTMTIPRIGHWRIPMWTYFRYDPLAFIGLNARVGGSGFLPLAKAIGGGDDILKSMNVTIEDQTVGYDPVELPDGTTVQVFAINATASFTNPSPVTFGEQAILPGSLPETSPHVELSLFFEEVRILRIKIHIGAIADGEETGFPSTFSLRPNRNVKSLRILAKADPYGAEKLAEWIGLYADGMDTELGIREVSVQAFSVVPVWIRDMLASWNFRVLVPGAQEEEVKAKATPQNLFKAISRAASVGPLPRRRG
ncbi:hypothetical protein HDU97_005144 [Phlyctochytrium planicorne]|nr:hypothetical protein HDU97_005144 [Phlyctochytrium planicorne]